MNKKCLQLVVLAVILYGYLLWYVLHQKSEKPLSPPVNPVTLSQTTGTQPMTSTTPTPSINQLPQVTAQPITPDERLAAALATPIKFFGKVVDETGKPVPDADVEIELVEHMNEEDMVRRIKSDENREFNSVGHGLGIQINVSKDGYYRLGESSAKFAYAEVAGKLDPHPDPNNPAIFLLRKMGKAEPLVRFEDRDIRISKNGVPVEFSLATGKVVHGSQSDIEVKTWTNDQGKKDTLVTV